MNQQEFTSLIWNHYLDIESEMLECLKYVELCTAHYCVYSAKFARILLECGAEIDNIFKYICSIRKKRPTISDYYYKAIIKIPDLLNYKVIIKHSPLSFQPFKSWNKNKPSQSLSWWEDYNKVKHDRINNFSLASLENALNSLCALFILEMLSYDELYKTNPDAYSNYPENESKLFQLDNHTVRIRAELTNSVINYEIEG